MMTIQSNMYDITSLFEGSIDCNDLIMWQR